MTTEMTVFNFDPNTNIRTAMINGEPHFVAKDICEALDIINHNGAITTLKENYERIGIDAKGVVIYYPLQTAGGIQETTVITEAGLYDLIAQSRKPNALKFKYWVHTEVLPSIRKSGSYSLMPKSFPEALRLYANELEMKELALKQRDEAVKTKSWIGSKREATSMATASTFSKQNDKLREQIGDSKTFKQVKAINWLGEFFDMRSANVYSAIGKQLSKLSASLGYESRKIEDSKYGEVKAYHYEVINSLKFKLKNDQNMMQRFRL